MPVLKPILENLAERIAAANAGRVYPAQILPCLPISLELIRGHLDGMVDDAVVFRHEDEGLVYYEFAELVGGEVRPLSTEHCVHCSDSVDPAELSVLCYACKDTLVRELMEEAEKTAWPAQAVWQHEIFYLAAQQENPVGVARIAGHSRLTFGKVKERLEELEKGGYARRDLDYAEGSSGYVFPEMEYPRAVFRRNDTSIRLHPSSYKEEWELRIIRSLIGLIILMIVCLALALAAHIPFPLLIAFGFISGTIIVWRTMTKSLQAGPDFTSDK